MARPSPRSLALDDFCQTGSTCTRRLLVADDTLPLIHAMRAGTAGQSELVRSAIMEGGRERFPGVLEAINTSGALEYSRAVAEREAASARSAVEPLPPSKYKDSLLELSAFSVARRS